MRSWLKQQEDVELAICTEFGSFASNVFWVDIPEELGNVVVLYEVGWFSLASYEQFWSAEQKISSPRTFQWIL